MKTKKNTKKVSITFLKNIKRLLLIPLLALFSCSNSDNTPPASFTPQSITPILIGKGHLATNFIYSQQNLVINENVDWQELLTNFNSIDPNSTASFTEINVDFESFTVIVAIDVANSTTTVDVTSVTENLDSVVVVIENLQMGISQDVSMPFHIVKIPKTSKPITFE